VPTLGYSPYYPLRAEDERYAILISMALFYAVIFFIIPAMKAFYWKKKNIAISTDDLQKLIFIFKIENQNDPAFLQHRFSNANMLHLNAVRNELNHEDLSELLANWKRNFWVLRYLCRCMGDRQAELEIIRIYNLVNSGNVRAAVRFRFNFSTGPHSHPYFVALCLTQILYIILVKYLAKNLWHFLLTKNHPSTAVNPSLDIYVNLKDTIDEQKSNTNYIGFRGVMERDDLTLANCFSARNANRHGKYRKTEIYWESFLNSIIKLLERFNRADDAREVRIILTRLQAARRNGTDVTYEDLFSF
jgi:hypothetical protein